VYTLSVKCELKNILIEGERENYIIRRHLLMDDKLVHSINISIFLYDHVVHTKA
jgi:hypothetical protein